MNPRTIDRSGEGMPMRLRCTCLVINAPDDLRVVEQDAGEPAAGQVVVQVGYGGICGSDLHYFHAGGFGTVRIKPPMILGHEVAGTVAAVAPGVTPTPVASGNAPASPTPSPSGSPDASSCGSAGACSWAAKARTSVGPGCWRQS